MEAAIQSEATGTPSSDNSDHNGQQQQSRRQRRALESPPPQEEPRFWMVCPCKSCEREDRPHTRMYSIVQKHLRQHLMGEKYTVCFIL
jgi:hypothetical protein